MAVKKIRMRPEGINDYGDILHPETSADQVIASDGVTTFESHLAESVQLRTWEKITEIVLLQNVAQVDFENLSEYKEFRLLIQGNTTGTVNRSIRMTFNDISPFINLTDVLVPISRGKGYVEVFISNLPNSFSMVYANGVTSNQDTTIARVPNTMVGKWESTDKINKINLPINSDMISSGSVFSLWGVK